VNGFNFTGELVTASGAGDGGNGALVNTGPQQTSALRNVILTGDTTFGGTGRWDIRASSSSSTNGCSLATGGQPFKITKVGTNQVSLVAVSVDGGLGDIDVKEGVFAIQTVTSQVGNPSRTITVFPGATLNLWNLNTAPLNKRVVLSNNATLWNESGSSIVIGPVILTNGITTFNVGGTSLSISNNVISGVGALTKTGAGTLTLRGANTYSGSTLVSTGTLALVGSGGIANSPIITIASGAVLDVSGRSDGKLTLAGGQTLTGNGAIYGSLLVSGNAVVAPGGSIGILTVTNVVTLQATTLMELDAQNGTNDVIYGAQTINYGGTLALTNISGVLVNGSSFKLFYAANYSGAFTNFLPATPGSGLAWDTSSLTSDGTLRVTKAGSPGISGISVSGGNFILSGTNGKAGSPYYLLASTNVALAVINWLRMQTNFFDVNGNFNATSAIDPNLTQQFFLIEEP